MKQYKFYLTDTQRGITRELQHDLDEWKSFGISFGRAKLESVIKSYSAGFSFIKSDANWLKDIVFTRGFNVIIRLDVFIVQFGGVEELQYQGFLDLTDPTINGNTFNCPINSGGFFKVLENCRNDEYEIKAINEIDGLFYDDYFKDINFNGGEYELEEDLGLLDETQSYGDVRISLQRKDPSYLPSFTNLTALPVKRRHKRDGKLRFFNNAKTLFTTDYDNEITNDQCFILSPDNINGGKLYFNLSQPFGDIEIKGLPAFILYPNVHYALSTQRVKTRLGYRIYIWKDIEERWISYENMITSQPIANTIERLYDFESGLYYQDKDGNVFIDYKCKDIFLEDVELSIDGYLANIPRGVGYKIAIFFTTPDIQLYYKVTWKSNPQASQISNRYISLTTMEADKVIVSTELKNPVFIPNRNFRILYRNSNFVLNRDRTVHGIYYSDLFKALIDKMNATYSVSASLPKRLIKTERYKVNVDISSLEPQDYHVLASGTTLLGSKQAVSDAGISSGIKTSLNDFLDYVYKVRDLKLVCTYDRNSDTYFLTLKNTSACYQNVKIQDIDTISDLTITSDRENIYTLVKVGYANTNDAIFGQLEYNTINNFKTGNTERETNELDLVSKYKGGALDVETYVHDKYGDFEDTQDGSGDVYILSMGSNKNYASHSLRREVPTDGGRVKVAINTMYSPKRLLINKYRELSSYFVFSPVLKFLSSERNANFAWHFRENDDLDLNTVNNRTTWANAVTKPFLIEVKVPAVRKMIQAIEANPMGYFEFKVGGKTYKGYIADGTESVQVNPMNEQATIIKLIAHIDSDL